ncbi:MAG: hypothetical protein PHQ60_13785 [Sideroxydans sp.]|nr:hypothetical protein [Sideroxydans sp.]
MEFKPSFRVHLADPLGYIDTPFIVTTAYTSAKGFPRAEWFLVIPEDKGLLIGQRNKLDQADFAEERVEFNEELLLNEALDQAILCLRSHTMERKAKLSPLLLASHIGVKLSDHHHLVKLWMRGSYCGSLSEIRAKTECTPLKETLVWIHGLPMLSVGDL